MRERRYDSGAIVEWWLADVDTFADLEEGEYFSPAKTGGLFLKTDPTVYRRDMGGHAVAAINAGNESILGVAYRDFPPDEPVVRVRVEMVVREAREFSDIREVIDGGTEIKEVARDRRPRLVE